MTATNRDSATKLIYTGDTLTAVSVQTFSLKVVAGPQKGLEVVSEGDELFVGSAKGCDLSLAGDDTVSRSHCVVRATEKGFLLQDLGSTNGTWVGATQVESGYLAPKAEISVGRSRIRFKPLGKRVEHALSDETSFGDLVGESAEMRDVFNRLARVAPTDMTVLIEGESGTGKELAAHAIHSASQRADGPFEVFDCGAVAPAVIESELFGHEKGSFTGATAQYCGVFERADGGTLFIDEVGELRTDLQPKLLRALETGEFRRVGGSQPVRVDARVIAATNRDLRPEVNSGGFRLDLFFRLSGVRVTMPPLRSRPTDIPLLVRVFADEFARRHGAPALTGHVSEETLTALARHPWPGNVRELRNFVEQTLVMAELAELPNPETTPRAESGLQVRTDLPYKEARERLLDTFLRTYFSELLTRNKFNVTKMAKEAGIDRVYAQRVIKKYGLK